MNENITNPQEAKTEYTKRVAALVRKIHPSCALAQMDDVVAASMSFLTQFADPAGVPSRLVKAMSDLDNIVTSSMPQDQQGDRSKVRQVVESLSTTLAGMAPEYGMLLDFFKPSEPGNVVLGGGMEFFGEAKSLADLVVDYPGVVDPSFMQMFAGQGGVGDDTEDATRKDIQVQLPGGQTAMVSLDDLARNFGGGDGDDGSDENASEEPNLAHFVMVGWLLAEQERIWPSAPALFHSELAALAAHVLLEDTQLDSYEDHTAVFSKAFGGKERPVWGLETSMRVLDLLTRAVKKKQTVVMTLVDQLSLSQLGQLIDAGLINDEIQRLFQLTREHNANMYLGEDSEAASVELFQVQKKLQAEIAKLARGHKGNKDQEVERRCRLIVSSVLGKVSAEDEKRIIPLSVAVMQLQRGIAMDTTAGDTSVSMPSGASEVFAALRMLLDELMGRYLPACVDNDELMRQRRTQFVSALTMFSPDVGMFDGTPGITQAVMDDIIKRHCSAETAANIPVGEAAPKGPNPGEVVH